MRTFADRLGEVIGENDTPHGWAVAHGLRPQKVWDWLNNSRQPQRAQLVDLAQRTGIPAEWWESGQTPAPAAHCTMEPVVQYQIQTQAAAPPMAVSRQPSDPGAHERQQMLLAVLRTMERLLLEPISQETAAAMLEVVDSWQAFTQGAPDLQQRLAAVRSAAWLYSSVQSRPK